MKTLLTNAMILAWENGNFKCIANGCIGIDEDVIEYVGDTRPTAEYDREIDMSGKLLMPGLFNCHTHAAMTLLRASACSGVPLKGTFFIF